MNLPDSFDLNENEIAFHFDTNAAIDARRLALFIAAMSQEIARAPEFGGRAIPILRRLTTNSPTTVVWEVLDKVAMLYAAFEFANRLAAQALSLTKPRWLRRLAEVMEDDAVPVVQVLARPTESKLPYPIDLVRELMPAIAELRASRLPANDIPGITRSSGPAFDPRSFQRSPSSAGTVKQRPAIKDVEADRIETDVPENALTFDGEPLTVDGEYLTVGEASPTQTPRAMPGTTGRAVIARPGMEASAGLGKSLGLMGRFVEVAGWNEIVFESGDEVFEVVGASRRDDLPLGKNVTVTAAIDWDQPGTIIISGWSYGERVLKE